MKNYKVSFSGAKVSASSSSSTGSKIVSAKSESEAKSKLESQYYSIIITSVQQV